MKTITSRLFLAALIVVVSSLGLRAGPKSASASDAVTLTLNLDREVLPTGKADTAIVKVSVLGRTLARQDRAPVNLAIVIDRSGSMSGDKLYHAKEAAIAAVRRLSEDDMVSIIA